MRYLSSALVVVCLLFSIAPAFPQSAVELYTMGPGEELFSKFGHAALCITSPELPGGGTCYNYGTTDFSRPIGLGWDVIRGRARFWVSVSSLFEMLIWFESEDRTIYRQVVPFEPERVEHVRRLLETDALPENREYTYSHFLENCSTRPRDLLDEAANGALRSSSIPNRRTYRDFARAGLAGSHWALVPAGDLILGRWTDQEMGVYEAMFIPDVLRAATAHDLGAEARAVYERRGSASAVDVPGALARFWLAVLAAVALAWLSRRGAGAVVVVMSLLGLAIWAGAVLSPWPELRVNELILVLMPFDIALFSNKLRRGYAKARLALLAVVFLLALVGVFVQPVWPFWSLAFGAVGAFGWRARRDILAT